MTTAAKHPRQIVLSLDRILREERDTPGRTRAIAAEGVYRAWLRSGTEVAMRLSALTEADLRQMVDAIVQHLTEQIATIDEAMYQCIRLLADRTTD